MTLKGTNSVYDMLVLGFDFLSFHSQACLSSSHLMNPPCAGIYLLSQGQITGTKPGAGRQVSDPGVTARVGRKVWKGGRLGGGDRFSLAMAIV